ncbi:MAG: stimulus-sensing domain-containing protein [Alphaproteobacteria bacterium]|nr:stimulus-sensing domain-containing protein [Alphaproteobacteria bacterium SS10]
MPPGLWFGRAAVLNEIKRDLGQDGGAGSASAARPLAAAGPFNPNTRLNVGPAPGDVLPELESPSADNRPADAEPVKGNRQRAFSTLTLRILAVNLMALLVLVGSVMFLDQYRRQLIERELTNLATEAQIFAAMVGEGAVVEDVDNEIVLSPPLGRQMVRRLNETTQTRSRLFLGNGQVVADSHMLRGGLGIVEIEELPPLVNDETAVWNNSWHLSDRWADLLGMPAPAEDDGGRQLARGTAITQSAMENVNRALVGHVSSTAWASDGDDVAFTAAAPVQQFKQVLGAVLLIRDGSQLKAAMTEVRRSILYISMIALSVTVLLSLYLAGTIERPLRRLARAADRVRNSPGRTSQIPDFTARRDEIGDLSLALREMTETLWQRLDSIEAFAADVAHEIKNPLTSLRSAVETASRVTDPVQQQKLMAIVQDDVRRLDRLITDISNASRLDAELSRANAEVIDLSQMLGMLADMYRHTIASDGEDEAPVEFILSLPQAGKLHVLGLEGRLVQVLQNLITNAMSFSPAGGRIILTATHHSERAIITVEDDGPGIPEGKLDAIFDRFYSERPKTEKFGTHSGLGLSISKQIIEAHNGTIRVENRYSGKDVIGARFIIDLPAADPSVTRAARRDRPVEKGRGKRKSAA